jgi:hypothetical protein
VPIKPKTACFRCGKAAESGTVCNACQPAHNQTLAERNKHKNDHADHAPYRKPEWVRFSRQLRDQNPQCQRIGLNRQRCGRPCVLTHHLISPKQCAALFLSPKNVVALCRECHPPSEGEPINSSAIYTPTIWYKESFSHTDVSGRLLLPSLVASGIDNWLRSMQSNVKPL